MVYKLIMYSKGRKKLLKTAGSETGIDKRTINTAISTLAMTSVHASIYIVESISWEAIYIDNFAKILTNELRSFLFTVGKVADTASVIPRLWEFYVYFARIPAFRVDVIKLYTCGLVSFKFRGNASVG